MNKLFVDKKIEIDSPATTVWEILTDSSYTSQWASEFANGAKLRIESDWKLDSPVLWKDQNNGVIVRGTVTALKPFTLIRFTVFDTGTKESVVTQEDGITYEFIQKGDKTLLHILHGDFSALPEGEKFRDITNEIWDRVLPRVKELAERK